MTDDIKIHPAAECVRMMDEDELASLAASIEAHGQRDPIVMGCVNGASVELLVDGRNRLRACEMAGVAPRFVTIEFSNDDDVRNFVAIRNDRRNITKGQKAMAVALLWPEPDKAHRGKKGTSKSAAENAGLSLRRLEQARAVLRHSRDLALAVRDGTVTLDAALKEIEDSRRALQSTEAQLAQLRGEAPDLADLVTEERLSLADAFAALAKRHAERREQLETCVRIVADTISHLTAFGGSESFCETAAACLDDDETRVEVTRRIGREPVDLEKIERGCVAFRSLLRRRFKP